MPKFGFLAHASEILTMHLNGQDDRKRGPGFEDGNLDLSMLACRLLIVVQSLAVQRACLNINLMTTLPRCHGNHC